MRIQQKEMRMAQLHQWQLPSKEFLVNGFRKGRECLLNASDTGTGKTLVAAVAIGELKRPVLIICPKAVKATWEYWLAEFGSRSHVLDIVNPERMVLGRTRWWDGSKWSIPAGSLVLYDEAHKGLAGPDTKTTAMIALLKAYKIPVLLQSATIADSPLQLRAPGYLLGLHNYNKASYYNWCREHACHQSPFHRGLVFDRGAKGRDAVLRIHNAIRDKLVRIRIEDIPDFPEGIVEAKLYELDPYYTDETNKAYEEAAREMQARSSNPLVVMGKARQKAELMKVPLMLDLIEDTLEENMSAVVFVNYKDSMYALKEALQVPCVTISGDDKSEEERQANIDRFQRNEVHVAVVITAAGGAGISLHSAERPRRSFLNATPSARDCVQALGRIRRVGGSSVVQTFINAAGTIEEEIYKSLTNKFGRMDTLVDGDLKLSIEK